MLMNSRTLAANGCAMTVPSDAEIVVELAAELIGIQRVAPFRLGIYYNAKIEPARVTVHKVVKNGTMGQVEFNSLVPARIWCEGALIEGYSVVRLVAGAEREASVSKRRRYYEQVERRQQSDIDDDEIPF